MRNCAKFTLVFFIKCDITQNKICSIILLLYVYISQRKTVQLDLICLFGRYVEI